MIGVLLIGSEIVCAGVQALLKDEHGMSFVSISHHLDALRLVKKHRFSVGLVDVDFIDGDGLVFMRRLREARPGLKLIALSAQRDAFHLRAYYKAGVLSCLSPLTSSAVIREAIKRVLSGEYFVENDLAREIVQPTQGSEPDGGFFDTLSPREIQVLKHIGQGCSVAQIAGMLNMAPSTVRSHRSRIRAKFGAGNDVQLLQRAKRLGLVR